MLTKIEIPDLSPFVPANSIALLTQWLDVPGAELRITKRRSSKLGDYRPIDRGKRHLISVNGSLNQYAFLLTLVHEIAHMNNFIKFKGKVKPHGGQWKDEFKELMSEFDISKVFPHQLVPKIIAYMTNPKASSSSDIVLSLAFREYDEKEENYVVLTEIEEDAMFNTRNGRTFIKGPRLRKRFKCKELKTGRLYLFNPISEVFPA